mmetsp:Transcript_1809/g.3838  ORF Transcript_1809/g.3838 Transcript_1809/m.3838 type:complete len:105 (-) Transcript_1809:130-444(-)
MYLAESCPAQPAVLESADSSPPTRAVPFRLSHSEQEQNPNDAVHPSRHEEYRKPHCPTAQILANRLTAFPDHRRSQTDKWRIGTTANSCSDFSRWRFASRGIQE